MKSRTSKQFRDLFDALPKAAQRQDIQAYRLFQVDPNHPSLRFSRVHPTLPVYSARRVGIHYRVLGTRRGDKIVRSWIGTHGEYDKLLDQL
jgi:hypothetical protein